MFVLHVHAECVWCFGYMNILCTQATVYICMVHTYLGQMMSHLSTYTNAYGCLILYYIQSFIVWHKIQNYVYEDKGTSWYHTYVLIWNMNNNGTYGWSHIKYLLSHFLMNLSTTRSVYVFVLFLWQDQSSA